MAITRASHPVGQSLFGKREFASLGDEYFTWEQRRRVVEWACQEWVLSANLKLMSLNVGHKLVDSEAWDACLEKCSLSHRYWGLLFVSECDGVLDDMQSLHSGPHLTIRHRPGAGSFPMTIMLNARLRSYLRSRLPCGQAMQMHLRIIKNF